MPSEDIYFRKVRCTEQMLTDINGGRRYIWNRREEEESKN
jgi:hypothetical protein